MSLISSSGERLYRGRARIEQLVGKLKRFKRVALRCEKTARNYGLGRGARTRLHPRQIRPHDLRGALSRRLTIPVR